MNRGIVSKATGFRLAAMACLIACLSLGAGGCADNGSSDESAGPVTRLSQNHPTNVDLKHDLPVPRDKVLTMQVDFALRNQAEFDQLSREIDDKKSPHYHQWLTPEQVHQRF